MFNENIKGKKISNVLNLCLNSYISLFKKDIFVFVLKGNIKNDFLKKVLATNVPGNS